MSLNDVIYPAIALGLALNTGSNNEAGATKNKQPAKIVNEAKAEAENLQLRTKRPRKASVYPNLRKW